MQRVYLALSVLVVAAVVLFMVQNLQDVTVRFAWTSATMPIAVLIVVTYVLGMFTGGALLALVRSWFRGAARGKPSDSGAATG
jgi:putative membrane protein